MESGEPEVGDANLVVSVKQHVLQLDVPVDDSHVVEILHGVDHLPEERSRLHFIQVAHLIDIV